MLVKISLYTYFNDYLFKKLYFVVYLIYLMMLDSFHFYFEKDSSCKYIVIPLYLYNESLSLTFLILNLYSKKRLFLND